MTSKKWSLFLVKNVVVFFLCNGSFFVDSFVLLPYTATSTTKADTRTVLHANKDNKNNDISNEEEVPTLSFINRRTILATAAATALTSTTASWAASDTPDTLDVDSFLRSGQVSNPMGVSGQAGKSRPETGIVFRDGSEVSRDGRSGDVLAEILLGSRANPIPVLASFSSPWPLAKGTVFDVECRDAKTGDGAFLAVTSDTNGKSISDLPSSFFLDRLFSPTGRFSFYGPPTDIRVKQSYAITNNNNNNNDYRIIQVSFSNVSQSTQTEIPRIAMIATTIPDGTSQAVMLVGSASASRWRRSGADELVRNTIESFRAIPAPSSRLKVRAKDRS